MNRKINFRPAFDKRHPDPKKNYGIHGMEIAFLLVGELGATQFVLYTAWHLPHVRREAEAWPRWMLEPKGYDIGYHSPKPMYEGQTAMGEEGDCQYVPAGCKCYYDGSSLMAEPVMETLIAEGDEAVWKRLEQDYTSRFGELR